MSVKLNIERTVLLNYYDDSIVAEVRGHTIGECLDDAVSQYPNVKKAMFDENGELHTDNLFVVNGEGALENALTRVVQNGDKIEIIRYAGG